MLGGSCAQDNQITSDGQTVRLQSPEQIGAFCILLLTDYRYAVAFIAGLLLRELIQGALTLWRDHAGWKDR